MEKLNVMKKLALMLCALVMIGLNSCNDSNEDPSGTSAKVNFYLVDAPGDFDEVWIEILALRVLMNDDSEEEESEWTEIPYDESDRYLDLLSLVGENSAFLGTEILPEGEIQQLRVILGEDNFVIKDGERFELKTPSAQQSGLKFRVDEPIQGGQEYGLVIDFDVEKSIVSAGNSGNIILKPVLRAFIEETATGIQGQVLPLEAQEIFVLASGEGKEYNTKTDENGVFKILGIADGIYKLEITPNESYQPMMIENVEVVDGAIEVLEPIVLEEK